MALAAALALYCVCIVYYIARMTQAYAAIVHRDGDAVFGAFFPDVPGCYANGETLDAVLAAAARALRFHLDTLEDEGVCLPAARTLQQVIEDEALAEDRSDAYAVLPVRPLAKAGRPKRVNINVDEFALRRIDRAAEEAGLSRSRFLVESALKAAEG